MTNQNGRDVTCNPSSGKFSLKICSINFVLIQSVVVLKKRNLTYKSNNTVRRTGINVDKLASNMHNIENLIQPNYMDS